MGSANHLTIDFEDWYHGLTSTAVMRPDWGNFESRIVRNTTWLLHVLLEARVRATFFILGQVAAEHPELVADISQAGHEIGVHGCYHQMVSTMAREDFRRDLWENIKLVERACGQRPIGFRAPYFSLPQRGEWVWEVLAEAGLRYDSSVFPIKTPLYGLPKARRQPHSIRTVYGPVREFPISTLRVMGINLPFSGGFYFRMWPYRCVRAITRNLNAGGQSVLFYFQPWEFDPDHPRPRSVTWRERLSHYGGLRGARKKFRRLLADFQFTLLGRELEKLNEG